jgi:hypothetical protein
MSNYDTIIELWKSGKVREACKLYIQAKEDGLLTPEEIKKLEKMLPDEWQLFFGDIKDRDPEFPLKLYNLISSERRWDDDMMGRKLKISKEDIRLIKDGRSRSVSVRKKLLVGYLNTLEQEGKK